MTKYEQAVKLLDTAYRAIRLAQDIAPEATAILKERLLVSALLDKITQLQDRVTVLMAANARYDQLLRQRNTTIAALNTQIANKTTQINSLNSQVTALQASETALQSQVGNLTANVTTYQTQATDATNQLTALQATVADKDAQIASLQAVVNNSDLVQAIDAQIGTDWLDPDTRADLMDE